MHLENPLRRMKLATCLILAIVYCMVSSVAPTSAVLTSTIRILLECTSDFYNILLSTLPSIPVDPLIVSDFVLVSTPRSDLNRLSDPTNSDDEENDGFDVAVWGQKRRERPQATWLDTFGTIKVWPPLWGRPVSHVRARSEFQLCHNENVVWLIAHHPEPTPIVAAVLSWWYPEVLHT